MKEKIEIITRFSSPVMTAKEYIDFSRNVLLHLRNFHPIFETVFSWGGQPSSWTEIMSDFSNFNSVVFQHIYDNEINYRNPNNLKGFLPESISWAGFSNAYSNTQKPQDAKYSVSIGAGNEDGIGFINIELPQLNFDEFYELKTVKALISHILQVVQLNTAYAITESLFDAVVDFDKPYDVQIGWLNFFANKRISANLPKDVTQALSSEGCFFWLDDNIGLPSTYLIQKAINIRDILGELDYLR